MYIVHMILRFHNGWDDNGHENTLNWEELNKGIVIVSGIAIAKKIVPTFNNTNLWIQSWEWLCANNFPK